MSADRSYSEAFVDFGYSVGVGVGMFFGMGAPAARVSTRLLGSVAMLAWMLGLSWLLRVGRQFLRKRVGGAL